MKIKTFGNRNPLSGLPQLEKAWAEMGHEIVDENPNLLYDANGYFGELLEDSLRYPKAVKIGCLLDASPLDPNWGPPEMVRNQLSQLDVAVTISQTAQKQILYRTGVKCEVVGYPIKNLTKLNYPVRGVRMLVVGRVFSENKRLHLIKSTAEAYCGDAEQVLFVGPEKPPFGIYAGLVNEEMLNVYYNSSVYLLGLSSVEGLFLSPLEACVTKTVPILASDNSCAAELGLSDFCANPHPVALANKMKEIDKNFDKYLKKVDVLGEKFKKQFSAQTVAQNILDLYHQFVKNKQL